MVSIKKTVKIVASLILAVAIMLVGSASVKVYAATEIFWVWVPSIPTYNEPGIPGNYLPSKVFTVPEGAHIMSVTVKALPSTGDPTCAHAVIQQWTGTGWRYIVGEWLLTDGEPVHISGGVLHVNPGEKYRVICSCTEGKQPESSADIMIVFVTT